MFKGFWAIVYKEIRQVLRDPSTRLVFLIPVFQTIIFGFAIDMDVRDIATVYCDMDRSSESRRLIERFENTGTFKIVGEAANEEEIYRSIVAGHAQVGILVPPDYSADLLAGRDARAQMLIDGSNSNVATAALQTSRAVGQVQTAKLLGQDMDNPLMDVRPRMLFNPDLLSPNFYIPGLIGIILQIVTTMLTAFAVVRERERGTLEQLSVTPVSTSALIVGKLAPYFAIGMIQSVGVLLLLRFLFGIPIEGSVILLLMLSALFLLPALSLGILISTFATNQGQAMQMSILVILPSVLLSGFAFPRETMPLPIYGISCLVPATYFVQILRGVILRGAGIRELWPQTLVLAGFAVMLVTLSVARFKKRVR